MQCWWAGLTPSLCPSVEKTVTLEQGLKPLGPTPFDITVTSLLGRGWRDVPAGGGGVF